MAISDNLLKFVRKLSVWKHSICRWMWGRLCYVIEL